jgi:hypothetical protein
MFNGDLELKVSYFDVIHLLFDSGSDADFFRSGAKIAGKAHCEFVVHFCLENV